jgi:hypothetical protein
MHRYELKQDFWNKRLHISVMVIATSVTAIAPRKQAIVWMFKLISTNFKNRNHILCKYFFVNSVRSKKPFTEETVKFSGQSETIFKLGLMGYPTYDTQRKSRKKK